PTLGNHDAISADSSTQSGVYYYIFTMPTAAEAGGFASGTEAYYSFDYANIHFVCLDSHATDRSPSGAMATWLKNDLALTSQEFLIAFWHHPPYSRGSHNSDNTGEDRMREMRQVFVPIMEDYGVDLVLAGHSHIYERSMLIDGHTGYSDTFDPVTMALDDGDGDPGGTDGAYQKIPNPNQGAIYTVAGSSGKLGSAATPHPIMIRHLLELGSVIIDVSGKVMDVRFIDDEANELDSFRIEHIDPPVGAPVLTNNSLSLIVGTPVTIQTSDLSATDSDTPPGTLTFTVSNLSGGNFKVGGSTVTSFTQQQVIDGDVEFEPAGTTAPTFSVKVGDGSLDSGFPEDAVVFFHEEDGDSRSAAFELLFASSDTQFDSDCPISFGTREDGNNVYATYTFRHTIDLSSLPSGLVVSFSDSPDGPFTAVSANAGPIDHGDGTQTSTFEDSVPVNNNGTLTTRFGKITVGGEDSEIFATVPTTILGAPDSAPTTVSVHSFSPGVLGPVIASGTATDVDPSTLTNTDSILGSLAPGQFYVSLTSGDDEGARATITGNTATQLTLDADLSGLDVVGESYEVRKHLSIASPFGATNEAGLHAAINPSMADKVLLTRDA
ncbi:MAG: cadherin-like domain-containing protein, partial [Verrucomicrobiales bacterium]